MSIGDDDENLFVFPPKADEKCYTCALSLYYAMSWPQNLSQKPHYTGTVSWSREMAKDVGRHVTIPFQLEWTLPGVRVQ